MKINIQRPYQCKFSELKKGQLFEYEGGIYCRADLKTMDATAIYKLLGMINTGDLQTFSDHMVNLVTEANFTVG